MAHNDIKSSHRQRGASAVEFAFIVVMFLTLLFGIVEFGRLFFNINSVQEITRRAAREQVVRWVSATDTVQREAVLQPGSTGTVYYPGAIDINNTQVQLSFYNTYADAASGTSPLGSPASPPGTLRLVTVVVSAEPPASTARCSAIHSTISVAPAS